MSAPTTDLELRAAVRQPNRAVAPGSVQLRVARGIALGGYMGASIELTGSAPFARGPLTAWLLLAETIPAGTDGTPVARLLVRNALKVHWGANAHRFESRPMSLPTGANPQRLRVVGWVENAQGNVVASAASVCAKPAP
jgi:hypothetical protein